MAKSIERSNTLAFTNLTRVRSQQKETFFPKSVVAFLKLIFRLTNAELCPVERFWGLLAQATLNRVHLVRVAASLAVLQKILMSRIINTRLLT